MSWHAKEAARATLRTLPNDLRRARLLAARGYAVGSIGRRAILSGQWDGGSVVGQYLKEDHRS